MKYVLLLLTASLLFGCGSDDEPDYTGEWVMVALKDDCANPDNNGRNDAGPDGLCKADGNAQECIDIELSILADGITTLRTKSKITTGAVVLSKPWVTVDGTYTVTGTSMVGTYGSSVIRFEGNEAGTLLDWIVSTVGDCERKYEFIRS